MAESLLAVESRRCSGIVRGFSSGETIVSDLKKSAMSLRPCLTASPAASKGFGIVSGVWGRDFPSGVSVDRLVSLPRPARRFGCPT